MSETRPLTRSRSKTTIPPLRPELVIARPRLLDQLDAVADRRLVSVHGPAGYGKTTLLIQWAAANPRPFAWVTLDEQDGDPVLLLHSALASLAEALADPSLAGSRAVTVRALVGRLAAGLAGAPPSVLVLDDAHLLGEPALDAVALLAREVPAGSQLVLAARTAPASLVARWRVAGELGELGPDDLALTVDETRAATEAWSVVADEGAARDLHEATEGWPAGVYLGARAIASGEEPTDPLGVDRALQEYIRAEHLRGLTDAHLDFLRRSSVLERMCADLLDHALERDDSAAMLAALEEASLFLIPLDRTRSWYRYHELFRAVLFDELIRLEPGAPGEIRRRAAAWLEEHARLEEAMEIAIAAGDRDRMERILVALVFSLYREGRIGTIERWLAHFEDAATLARYPRVAVLGGLLHTLCGHAFQAERWLDAARRADATGPLPDGSASIDAWIAAVEAISCRHGVAAMRADAERALAELGPLTPLRMPAMIALAYAELLDGDRDRAELLFDDVARAAAATGGLLAEAAAASQLGLLALERGDLGAAEPHIARATEIADGDELADYSTTALALAAGARFAAAQGDRTRVEELLRRAQRLRPSLTSAFPYHAVLCLLELARAAQAIGDGPTATALLVQIADIQRHRPDLGTLDEEVERFRRSRIGPAESADHGAATTLTAAELRLLPYLTTHLTFREIGDRLFLSRNTIKTQAISLYRKLGASSRAEAVAEAIRLGLVESHDPRPITRAG